MAEWQKFEKRITICEESFEVIRDSILRLLYCMKESNAINKLHTEYFKINLTDSEKVHNAKDLILEWACQKYDKEIEPHELPQPPEGL